MEKATDSRMDPLRLSATELAGFIRSMKLSSREVVEAHIARLKRVNPTINAVVADRFEAARAEADAADDLTKKNGKKDLPPLHGVPCTIKESFAFKGMPNTSGLVARKGVRVDRDATTVTRLREAGAIPLGVTNVSELCMWMESHNKVYGRTKNPYNPARIPGGSSGGEGAIIGAGGSPFGLGADIGGSIRIPAFCNGVFGHKPTGGLVPGTGQYPLSENEAARYVTTGPIARRAEDLFPLLKIMAGPDGEDEGCREIELGDPTEVDISSLRVIDVEDDGRVPVTPDLRMAQRRCAEYLAGLGCRVCRVHIDDLRYALEIWSSMLSAAEDTSFSVLLGNGRPIRPFREFARWMAGRSPHTLPALGLAVLERVPKLLARGASKMENLGQELRRQLVDLIGPGGIMLYPSHGAPAPRHYEPIFRLTRFSYTALFNVMEMPATQVPLGLNDKGLPLGVQVASIHGNDHITIAVAMELERAFGGWVFPPKL